MLAGCLGTALRLQLALEKSEAIMAARESEVRACALPSFLHRSHHMPPPVQVMEARRAREEVEMTLKRAFEMERMGLERVRTRTVPTPHSRHVIPAHALPSDDPRHARQGRAADRRGKRAGKLSLLEWGRC